MLRFDVSQLLSAAFAIKSQFIRFAASDKEAEKVLAGFPGASVVKTDDGLDFYAGNHFVAPFSFGGGSFKKFGDTGKLEDVQLSALALPPTTLLEFRRAKVVTKVQAAGKGTFKEIFAFGDWELNIYGVIIDYNGQRAEQILSDLLAREQIAGALPVAGKVFELLGIESILLENFEAKQVAGAPGRIPFSISATSDNQINTVGYGVGADL